MSKSRDHKAKATTASTQAANRESQQQDKAKGLHPLLELQQTIGNQAVLRLLGAGRLQAKPRDDTQYDSYEREADRIASQIVESNSGLMVQRKCAACSSGALCSECAPEESPLIQRKARSEPLSHTGLSIQRFPDNGSAASATNSATPATAPAPLLVEDEATEVGPGQMHKSEFLSQLRSAVCATADEALVKAGRNTEGCPYVEQWFAHYADKNSQYVERSLRRYAPEAAGAATARDYIPAVCNRVRRGVEVWAKTGEITGVPEELAGVLSGPGGMMGALGAIGGMIGSAVSGLVSGIGSAVSGLVSGVGSLVSGVGSIFRKERDGGGHEESSDGPDGIQAQLGAGHSLDSHVRAQMGAAFGRDFSGVRVHTDARSAELSDNLSARAFTIGSDIAFGAGEYQPGTLIGDALIAHELAHVVQQDGTGSSDAPMQKGAAEESSLEEEADSAAVDAVVSSWGIAKAGLMEIGKNAMPRLKSGLKLQRCGESFESRREAYLKEGLNRLNAAVCRFPYGGGAWDYDDVYWEKVPDASFGKAYKPKGVSPSEAIDKLFERLDLWEFDCAIYPEVALLYAYRHALGDSKFNSQFSNLRLKVHKTTGIPREVHDIDNGGEDAATFNKLWDDAPVGSKVMWTNRSAVTIGAAWHNENAIKSSKGNTPEDDLYDAHPLGANLSEDEVKKGLAENASDYPATGTDAAKEAYVKANIYRHQLQILK
ncbi:MAG: DUF4157 domain-containing protein [Pyrinomonadaceae bacterium]